MSYTVICADTLHRLFDRLSGGRHREIHLACAAVAFVGAAALEALVARALGSWVLWALFSLYLCPAGFMYWCWPRNTSLQEKVATLFPARVGFAARRAIFGRAQPGAGRLSRRDLLRG